MQIAGKEGSGGRRRSTHQRHGLFHRSMKKIEEEMVEGKEI